MLTIIFMRKGGNVCCDVKEGEDILLDQKLHHNHNNYSESPSSSPRFYQPENRKLATTASKITCYSWEILADLLTELSIGRTFSMVFKGKRDKRILFSSQDMQYSC